VKTLLAIDPGLRGVGAAYFVGPTLVYANYIQNPVTEGGGPAAWFGMGDAVYHDMKNRGYRVDIYVAEYPQVYRQSKGDPDDLIQIAAVAAACGASFPLERAVGYQPRAWKGQVKKEVHHPRILAQLAEEEKAAILEKRKTYIHNVYDAVGLGLFELERMRVRISK
jgi:hypothetical protein